jgi:methionine-rich copper-binding protein CopC
LPDVSRSVVTLTGPAGELTLRGLHTMGANDLMMEIYDEVISGSYTVEWQTRFEGDTVQYSGSYRFSVQAE